MDFEIYYNDLTPEAKANYDKAQEEQGWSADDNGNDDIVPIAVVGIEPRQEEKQKDETFCSKCGKVITEKTYSRNNGMCSTCWEERNE